MAVSIANGNTTYRNNLTALISEYPKLAEKIRAWCEDRANIEHLKNELDTITSQQKIKYSVAETELSPPDFLFVLGMGCDDFLTTLSRQIAHHTTVLVIEPDLSVFIKTIHVYDLSEMIRQWQVKFLIDVGPSSFSRYVDQYYFPITTYNLIEHPVRYEQCKPYFDEISREIDNYIARRKPATPTGRQLKFLVFAGTTGVGWPYIMQDVIAGLHRLGHEVRVFHLEDNNLSLQVREELRANRPDFILMLDAIGFMPGLFNAEKIPYISWFFDNPFNWLKPSHASDYYYTFLWDKTYVDELKQIGFKHVHYLPLAANEQVFYPRQQHKTCDISFVGSSLWKAPDLPFDNENKKAFIMLVSSMLCDTPWVPVWDLIDRLMKKAGGSFRLDDPERRAEFELFIQNYARTGYRKQIIQAILQYNPWLYGDPSWTKVIEGRGGIYKGRINNRIDLPALYSNSAININVTVPQLRNSFSHRAFEIPACGGFLLSDYRPEAESFFEVGTEIICFKTTTELQEYVSYFLKHPEERVQIAQRGRDRVLAEHTYVHRLKKMVDSINQ